MLRENADTPYVRGVGREDIYNLRQDVAQGSLTLRSVVIDLIKIKSSVEVHEARTCTSRLRHSWRRHDVPGLGRRVSRQRAADSRSQSLSWPDKYLF
jgi:hypothetical protein